MVQPASADEASRYQVQRPFTATTKANWLLRTLGLSALSFFCAHAACHVHRGDPENMLWACHVAVLLVSAGLLGRNPTINAIGVLILMVGLPAWLVGLLAGGPFLPTSLLTHIGGLVCGLLGALMLGLPRSNWKKSWCFFVYLLLVTRVGTTPDLNVNLAFQPWSAAKPFISAGLMHYVALIALWALFLWMAERILRAVARAL